MEENIREKQEEFPVQSRKGRRKTVLVSCLLALAIILCIWVISQILSRGYVSVGGCSLFRVVTGSMEPEIPVGALLVARETDIEDVEIGDIVVYRSATSGMSGMIITHRVVAIHEAGDGTRYLETKGDANQYADGTLVDGRFLIGRVTWYTGEGNVMTGVLSILTSKIGFLACIVLPCILIGMFIMRDCIKNLRSEMESINRELDEAKETREKGQSEPPKDETYEEMCERLRSELLEELKQSAEQAKTEQEPGAEQQP